MENNVFWSILTLVFVLKYFLILKHFPISILMSRKKFEDFYFLFLNMCNNLHIIWKICLYEHIFAYNVLNNFKLLNKFINFRYPNTNKFQILLHECKQFKITKQDWNYWNFWINICFIIIKYFEMYNLRYVTSLQFFCLNHKVRN